MGGGKRQAFSRGAFLRDFFAARFGLLGRRFTVSAASGGRISSRCRCLLVGRVACRLSRACYVRHGSSLMPCLIVSLIPAGGILPERNKVRLPVSTSPALQVKRGFVTGSQRRIAR